MAPQAEIVVATGVAANTAARACSFAGATTVLMADGSRKPIEDVKVGDEVIATDPEICPAVIGNVIVYRDGNHITSRYARTLAPYLGEELARVVD